MNDAQITDLKQCIDSRLSQSEDVLDTKIVALKDEMNRRFGLADKRFDGVDGKFEKADQRFDMVDVRFETIDQRFDGVDEKFENIDRRFDEADEKFTAVNRQLDKIDNRFNAVHQRFDDLNQKIDDGFAGIADVVEQIHKHIDDSEVVTDRRLTKLEQRVA